MLNRVNWCSPGELRATLDRVETENISEGKKRNKAARNCCTVRNTRRSDLNYTCAYAKTHSSLVGAPGCVRGGLRFAWASPAGRAAPPGSLQVFRLFDRAGGFHSGSFMPLWPRSKTAPSDSPCSVRLPIPCPESACASKPQSPQCASARISALHKIWRRVWANLPRGRWAFTRPSGEKCIT